jgi:hypothetical protein
MNYEEKVLREKIMRRVRFIHLMKSNALAFAAESVMLAVFVAAGSFFVSVPNVINNMPSVFEIGNLANFVVYAFLKTEIVMQMIFLGALAAFAYIVKDILKTFLGGSRQLISA